jgi:4-amino-4-deoxy-L-arabinose transferase-like glycosyltransferase
MCMTTEPSTTPPARGASTPAPPDPSPWLLRLVLLIAGVTLLRLLYLAFFCPYDLVEDEATYWEWSRRLSLSYYTKGPGIALAIRAATSIFGESEAAIRAVSVFASAVAALAIGALGAEAARSAPDAPRRWHVGFIAAALFLLMPIFQAVGLLATIDGPYVACWAAAAWAAFLAIERRASWAWPLVGLALGLGFLFKYTILLLIPGILLFAIARRARFSRTSSLVGFTLGAVILAACFAPVLVWNHQNGWPTIAHLLGHLGVAGGDMPAAPSNTSPTPYDPRWTLEFIGIQLGMVGPPLVLALGVAFRAFRRRRENPAAWPGQLFLIACAAPILVFYLLISLIAEPEGNWAMGGYITLAPLAAWGVADSLPRFRAALVRWHALPEPRPRAGFFRRRPELFEQVLWHWSIAYGVVAALAMARVDLIARVLPPISGRLGSVMTADVLAADAAAHAARLKSETGLEPFYIAQHYGRASILAYYIPGHPSVKCSSSRMAGRRTNYDYWADTDLDDPSLLGRPAVLIGALLEQWTPLFDRVVPIERLSGEHKKDRLAFVGYGYKGWPGVAPVTPRPPDPSASP